MNDLDATKALVTLEDARSYVLRSENDGGRDALLIDAINLVSSAIWRHCEREFLSTADATRTFALRRVIEDGWPVGWIDLAPYDLRTAVEVKIYTESASPQTLSTNEYRLRPVGGHPAGGTFLDILTLEPIGAQTQPGFGWEATVKGAWGMTAVPYDVRMAALQWIDNIVKNPGSYASVEMGGFAVVPDLDVGAAVRAGMPSAVKHRLHDFCRSIR